MPSRELALVVYCTMFDDRKSIRFFCTRTRRIRAMSNIVQYIMATLSIQRNTQRTFSIKEWAKVKGASVNKWLNTKSELYSRICEFSVTRRLVIRVNLVSLCLLVAAMAVEQQPVASVVSALCAAYLVYRLNKKEGGKL